jgi:hypothetical protein
MKGRAIVAAVVMAVALPAASAFAREPGAYDRHHRWHEAAWWHEHHHAWTHGNRSAGE